MAQNRTAKLEVPRWHFPWKWFFLTMALIVVLGGSGTFAGLSQTIWKSAGEINLPGGDNGEAGVLNVTPTETPTVTTAPTPTPLADSDNDGFSDWFETNVAGTDPTIPNNRYFILFCLTSDRPDVIEGDVHIPAQFLIEKGKVPPENIIKLTQEKATSSALETAIEQIAAKANANDIVFLNINTHGNENGFETDPDTFVTYDQFNGWLNQVKARALIVNLSACGSEIAVQKIKEGSCPRIFYLYNNGLIFDEFGREPNTAKIADLRYGNNDGYVSFGEMADCRDDVFITNGNTMYPSTFPATYKDGWPILRERPDANSVKEMRFSCLIDSHNLAYQTYLTDYNWKNALP